MRYPRPALSAVALAALLAGAGLAEAQSRVSLDAAGLMSVQPVDDTYVGSPYLDEGLGGVGPGLLVGVSVRVGRRGVIAGEFSQAWFSPELSGRLVRVAPAVPPSFGFTTPPTPARLHDRLLTGLAGVAVAHAGLAYRFLGGASWRLDDPTLDGDAVLGNPADQANDLTRLGLTGGVDVAASGDARVSPYLTVRYTFVDRRLREQELGIGRHVLRLGFGLRIGLGAR
jgi:hypothetical protein